MHDNYIHELLKNETTSFLNEHKLNGLIDKKTDYLKQLHRNTLYLELLREIEPLTTEHKIVLLKGISLLNRIYDDIGQRWMSDIDLLIDPTSLDVFNSWFADNGFQEIKSDKWEGNDFKIVWGKTVEGIEIVVELHTKLFFHHEFSDHLILPHSNLKSFYRLDNESEFLHLIGHLIFQHNFLKLYWTLDCYFYYKKLREKIDVSKLVSLAKSQELLTSLKIYIYVLKKYFYVEVSEDLSNQLNLNKFYFWKIVINKNLIFRPNQTSVRYLLFKNFTKDRLRTSIFYNIYWFKNKLVQKMNKS